MKIRQVTIKGATYWQLDAGKIDNQRKRFHFKTKSGAESRMAELQRQHVSAGKHWSKLDGPERQQTLRVLAEIAAAGLSVHAVWEAYRAGQTPRASTRVKLSQAIKDCILAKVNANCRPEYTRSLNDSLKHFAKGRQEATLDAITTATITDWVQEAKTPTSRRTRLYRLRTLFSLARKRRWIAANPCDEIETIRIEAKAPVIISVRAAALLLRLTKRKMPVLLPYVVLGLFCGIRPSELQRLTWADVDLKRKIVTVDAVASKVRRRRIVPIPDCAAAWLDGLPGDQVKPATPISLSNQPLLRRLRRLARRMGVKKIPVDILRHTAASYQCALHGATLTAEWLGNSEGILHRHYRQLVARETAEEFFKITP